MMSAVLPLVENMLRGKELIITQDKYAEGTFRNRDKIKERARLRARE